MIIVNAGRAKLAELIMNRPAHLALGLGGRDWDETPPDPSYEAAGLVREIGRRMSHRKFYVVPDAAGEIILPNDRRYAARETPTRHIYFQFVFDYGEGQGGSVRELGLFIDTKPKGNADPYGFLTPEDIEDPGTLLVLGHPSDPETFNPLKKGSYEAVVSF